MVFAIFSKYAVFFLTLLPWFSTLPCLCIILHFSVMLFVVIDSRRGCRAHTIQSSQISGALVCRWLRWPLENIPFRLRAPETWRRYSAQMLLRNTWKLPRLVYHFQVGTNSHYVGIPDAVLTLSAMVLRMESWYGSYSGRIYRIFSDTG